jgi:hypothetical protein
MLLVSAIATFEIGRRLAPALITWNKEIQNRVSITSSILPQVKSVKMIGLKPVVTGLVQDLRGTEIEYSKRFRLIQIVMKASGLSPPLLMVIANANTASSHVVLPAYGDNHHDRSYTVGDVIEWFGCV